jgi:hypothetical protein
MMNNRLARLRHTIRAISLPRVMVRFVRVPGWVCSGEDGREDLGILGKKGNTNVSSFASAGNVAAPWPSQNNMIEREKRSCCFHRFIVALNGVCSDKAKERKNTPPTQLYGRPSKILSVKGAPKAERGGGVEIESCRRFYNGPIFTCVCTYSTS